MGSFITGSNTASSGRVVFTPECRTGLPSAMQMNRSFENGCASQAGFSRHPEGHLEEVHYEEAEVRLVRLLATKATEAYDVPRLKRRE